MDGPVLSLAPSIGVFGGLDSIVSGTVVFDENAGCLYLGSSNSTHLRPVMWPFGASWQADPPAVKLQGQVIEPGMSVKGGGGEISIGSIDNVAGPDVADAAKLCAYHVDSERVAYFNVGSEVDVVP